MAAVNYTPISLYYSTTASAVPVNTNLVNGELAININTADGKLYYKDSAGVVQLLASKAGASGSVTSVAQSFTGGIVSVAGSPITSSGTLALTVAGTSGGVPYFSSGTTWASSAALTQYGVVYGGGAGAAPVATAAGTTGQSLLATTSSAPSWGQVSLTAGVTGTLPVANGGTNLTSFTNGGVVYASSTSALTTGTGIIYDSSGYHVSVWADKVSALGNTGTATTITCTAGNVFTATLTGNCTFTLSAPSTTTANTATSFTLILTNDATAGRTVAFAGGTFKYPGGSVTRTTTANATDIWFFFSPNGGTTWYVSIPMANLS